MPRGANQVGPGGIAGWQTDDWLTPPNLIQALGPFDLDPSASLGQPWRTATTQYTIVDDGLSKEWPRDSFIWLNCPYRTSGGVWRWLSRLADHGNGIALIFARTDTKGFHQTVWSRATGLYFIRGRVFFRLPGTGERARCNGGAPSVLALFGEEAMARASRLLAPASDYPGELVRLKPAPVALPAKPAARKRAKK